MTTTLPAAASTRDGELLGDALTDYVLAAGTDRASAAGAPEHVATWLADRGYRIVSVATDEPGLPAMEVLAPIIEAAGPEALDAWITVLARLRNAEQTSRRLQTLDELRSTGRSWLNLAGGRA